jgi:uncharacterized protein (DUF736 family)
MSEKYDNTNKGVLYVNDYKAEGDERPDWTGKLNVQGKEWKLAAWSRDSKKGNKFLSLSLKDPAEVGPRKQQSKPQEDPAF